MAEVEGRPRFVGTRSARTQQVGDREFRRVVERYASGNKAPDALVKIGFCYQRLGDAAAARDVLAQVIDIYPRTNAAKLAAERLAAPAEPRQRPRKETP